MTYIVSGVDPTRYIDLYGLADEELAPLKVVRRHVSEGMTIPERSELRNAPVGSSVLLVNYVHQPVLNPYYASHAIFIREGSTEKTVIRNRIPDVLASRVISLRAFDHDDMLAAADVTPGTSLEALVETYLARPDFAYLHAHFAKPGCFAAVITRD